MNKLYGLVCFLVLSGCANPSFVVPVGGPVVVTGDDGRAVRKCQIVVENGEPKSECVDQLVMNR